MQKIKLISQAREIETLFNAYLEVSYRARQDILRIVSSLETAVLNFDLLIAAGFPGKAQGGLESIPSQVRTLTVKALAAAKNSAAMIQANILKTHEGAAKTSELLMRLTRGEAAAEETYESLFLALIEINKLVLQVEEDALCCVAAVTALLPQVGTLRNCMLALLPRPQKANGQKPKKNRAGRTHGASLTLVESIY